MSGFFISKDYQNKQNAKDTNYLFALLQSYDSQDMAEFNKNLAHFEENSKTALKEIALMKQADHEILAGNIERAYEILDSIYNNNSSYKPYRDYAELMLNYIIYKFPNTNIEAKASMANISSDNIFYYTIVEIRSLGFVEQEKYAEAKNELDKIVTSADALVEHKKFAADLIRLLEEGDKI